MARTSLVRIVIALLGLMQIGLSHATGQSSSSSGAKSSSSTSAASSMSSRGSSTSAPVGGAASLSSTSAAYGRTSTSLAYGGAAGLSSTLTSAAPTGSGSSLTDGTNPYMNWQSVNFQATTLVVMLCTPGSMNITGSTISSASCPHKATIPNSPDGAPLPQSLASTEGDWMIIVVASNMVEIDPSSHATISTNVIVIISKTGGDCGCNDDTSSTSMATGGAAALSSTSGPVIPSSTSSSYAGAAGTVNGTVVSTTTPYAGAAGLPGSSTSYPADSGVSSTSSVAGVANPTNVSGSAAGVPYSGSTSAPTSANPVVASGTSTTQSVAGQAASDSGAGYGGSQTTTFVSQGITSYQGYNPSSSAPAYIAGAASIRPPTALGWCLGAAGLLAGLFGVVIL